ncbi:MAG: hypothetical protein ABJM29_00440 [Rhizobiaceae bacterium]|jgi:hypothetical protein
MVEFRFIDLTVSFQSIAKREPACHFTMEIANPSPLSRPHLIGGIGIMVVNINVRVQRLKIRDRLVRAQSVGSRAAVECQFSVLILQREWLLVCLAPDVL